MSLSDSVIRSFDGIASLSSYDISSTSSVPLPTTIEQAIQLPDSVISNNDCDGNENSRGGQLQQHQQSFSNDVYSTTPNGLKVSPVFGIENIYSGTGVSTIPVVDALLVSDDDEFDLLQSKKRGAFQRLPSFSNTLYKNITSSALKNENGDDDDDEEFLINSSSRIYIELNDMELPSVQASSFSTLAAQHSSSVPLLTDSSLSLQQVITPSTVASVIYNKLLTEETHPSSSITIKSSSRIRQQRKFGEIVTSDEFLEEIKHKTEKKRIKAKAAQQRKEKKRKISTKKKTQRKKAKTN
ncbi:unnamed protein product [Rotaria magnacalcarata]|uniref:Uncharacterized protein n=1 Tax=Rotaria magnacalcarata TaxID=392030 RepID=A0A820HDY2_9BILA|nr:unnamed protein product [Rotaria magnacalcarata]